MPARASLGPEQRRLSAVFTECFRLVTIRLSGATQLSHGRILRCGVLEPESGEGGTWIAEIMSMSRQAKGAAIAFAFVAAFIASVAFHSVVAAVIVLLSAITIAYVIGIAWMRTSAHRARNKQEGQHGVP